MIVGLIGAGNMAAALALGWAAAETGPDEIVVSDVDAERARSLADRVGARTAGSNRELAETADVVVLAIKPAALGRGRRGDPRDRPRARPAGGLDPRRRLDRRDRAGLRRRARRSCASCRTWRPRSAPGTFCYAPGSSIDDATERSMLDLFGLLGELVPVEERLMDAATAISGCGPAFFALVVESLTDAGVEGGPRRAAGGAARADDDGGHGRAAAPPRRGLAAAGP